MEMGSTARMQERVGVRFNTNCAVGGQEYGNWLGHRSDPCSSVFICGSLGPGQL
jgi:hypothetical protein